MKTGPDAILEKLYELESNVAGKHLRTALRVGAKIVQEQMIADAPVKSGVTRDAIKVRALKRSRTRMGIAVTIGQGWFKGKTFYAGFVNFGHRIGRRLSKGALAALPADPRSMVAGTHWMNAAWDKSIGRAAEAVFAKLKELAGQEGSK